MQQMNWKALFFKYKLQKILHKELFDHWKLSLKLFLHPPRIIFFLHLQTFVSKYNFLSNNWIL